ncbi:metallophosphoesterase family protein [Paraconexibacter algicola]|uniref:metallophosphoesterase family protein n=1 Tax=Paraconexibacter algicola TaxID=2133960 RepID=UPI0013049627|nr:metallophosphoesterase family protein [Paraconexibacter algicola]
MLSDVHGQVALLRRAVAAIDDHGCEEIWCLGDVVDALGAAPSADQEEAVALVASRCAVTLGGNHELWALERGQLSHATRLVLAGWAPRAERHGVLAVHASVIDPLYEFLDSPQVAAASLAELGAHLALFGHTHHPGMWGAAAGVPAPVWVSARTAPPVDLRTYQRALVNPGAIQHDLQPTYLLLDLTARTATWHPVPG